MNTEQFNIIKDQLTSSAGYHPSQVKIFTDNNLTYGIADGKTRSMMFCLVNNFNNFPNELLNIAEKIKREPWIVIIDDWNEDLDIIWKQL